MWKGISINKRYLISATVVILMVLSIAWFYNGGKHFYNVALICYGYFIGFLSGLLTRSLQSRNQ